MSIKELSLLDDDNGDAELTEVKDADINTTSGRESWTLDKLVPLNPPLECKIPQKVVIFMRSVERVMSLQGLNELEFGVFLKGKFVEGILHIDADAHFIPQQKVSGATIDFQEDPPDDSYNGVMHRHPTGCRKFSFVDSHSINRNFEFSLLYESNSIVDGIINIQCEGVRIQLPLAINILYPVFNIENVNTIISKIQKSVPPKNINYQNNNSFSKLLVDNNDQKLLFGESEQVFDSCGLNREVEELEDLDEDNLYICRHCNEINSSPEFPFVCEYCGANLVSEVDAELIADMSDLDNDLQMKVLEKYQNS